MPRPGTWTAGRTCAPGANPLRFNLADVTWDGTTLTAGLIIPTPPLVFDTTLFPDPGHFGFKATDSSGDLPVNTVNLTAGNTKVAFTFTRAATASRNLRVAQTGYAIPKVIADSPRCNLRDSTPTNPNWVLHDLIPF